MKTIITIILFPLIFLLSLISCKKDNCTFCNDNPDINANRGNVVANAGRDTTYEWPKDSILLDGSGSTTSIGNITQYSWSKVSGPDVIIVNPYSAKTILLDIMGGDYIFELKVRNSNGATATSLIKLRLVYNCNELELQVVKGPGRISKIGEMPIFLGNIDPFVFDNKIIVTNTKNGGLVDNFEIYNLNTKTWVSDYTARSNFFKGGQSIMNMGNYLGLVESTTNTYNLYDIKDNQWIRNIFPVKYGSTISKYKDFIFSGGGINNYSFAEDIVTVYNNNNASTNTINLSEARSGICIVGNKNKVFFAGGFRSIYIPASIYDDDPYPYNFTTRVDIYDLNTKNWKIAELSEERAGITAIVSGEKVIFSGGYNNKINDQYTVNSDLIDIYDMTNDSWTHTFMIDPSLIYSKKYIIENKILFIPENVPGRSDKLYLLDLSNYSWRSIEFPDTDLVRGDIAIVGNKLVILRTGNQLYENAISNNLDLYDYANDTWSRIELNLGYKGSLSSDGKNIYLIGGYLSKDFTQPPVCSTCRSHLLPSCGIYQISF